VKEETTYGLNPKRLARLLAMGLQSDGAPNNLGVSGTPAEVLQNMLGRKLPLDPAIPDSLPAILNRPCDELAIAGERTISDIVLDSKTDPAVIVLLKDYAKELVRRGGPEAKQAAATVIYYAAIAGALVFHQHKISRHSYPTLHEAYADLEREPWVPLDLRRLFRRARTMCQRRRRRAE
jgi:hypothetical protein